jgi:hypothetical protein
MPRHEAAQRLMLSEWLKSLRFLSRLRRDGMTNLLKAVSYFQGLPNSK